MARKMKIKSDKQANSTLRDQLQTVRGGILDAAEQQLLPSRFTTTQSELAPEILITDRKTGESSKVPLFAYRAVRTVLCDLFGDR